jgi:hypothetical protein
LLQCRKKQFTHKIKEKKACQTDHRRLARERIAKYCAIAAKMDIVGDIDGKLAGELSRDPVGEPP